MQKLLIVALSLLLSCFGSPDEHGAAQEMLTLEQLLVAFNWNLDEVEITAEAVDEGLFVLFGAGGNIGVSIGDQGVLIVDDMFPELMPRINAAIAVLGGGKIDFAINTHWHFDHAQGNLALGPAGTWIVAHEESTRRMSGDHPINLVRLVMEQKAYPPEARPVISFRDTMTFHFNGGDIELVHAGAAHTAGDAAVIFRKHNAVHMGDVFNNAGYPFVDVDSGGDIDGMIRFCQVIRSQIDDSTTVIPGHGAIVGTAELDAYIEMLITVRSRVADLIAQDKTLAEVEAAQVTAEFDATFGDPQMLGFVNRVFASLSAR